MLWAWILSAMAQDAVRGEQLAGLGGCAACHTAEGGPALAGGYRIETPFGVFYGPNLTPDPEHGLGRWTYDDFVAAMRRGHGERGRMLWPSFPYDAFTHVVDRDLADLWAWLQAAAPAAVPDRPHEVKPRYRGGLGLWRMVAFRAARRWDDGLSWDDAGVASIRDPSARGHYLAEGLGHCGGCHTPRSAIGVPSRREALGGWEVMDAPALVPLDWSPRELASFLEDGMTPDGDVTGGEMWRVISEGTSRLSAADREALAGWVLAQSP